MRSSKGLPDDVMVALSKTFWRITLGKDTMANCVTDKSPLAPEGVSLLSRTVFLNPDYTGVAEEHGIGIPVA